MCTQHPHFPERSIHSSVWIRSTPETIWQNITNVKIERFSHPFLFRLLGIPKPLHAEVITEGVGGSRVAIFDNGKRFVQKITAWLPSQEYAFSFEPEKGFRAGLIFDLSDGVFRMLRGSYRLQQGYSDVKLTLSSSYSIRPPFNYLIGPQVRLVLKLFQKYLLKSIKQNSEA